MNFQINLITKYKKADFVCLDKLEIKLALAERNKSISQLEDELISIFGTKVRLRHKGKKGGSIQIDYFSNDDLDRILDLIRSIE